jgi:hypothetical protein
MIYRKAQTIEGLVFRNSQTLRPGIDNNATWVIAAITVVSLLPGCRRSYAVVPVGDHYRRYEQVCFHFDP